MIPPPESYRPMTIGGMLMTAARRDPGKTAIRHGDRQRTWSAFGTRIDALARLAITEFHLGRERRAAILAHNAIEYLEIVAGIPESGAAVATLSPRATATELAAICADCLPRVLFADAEGAALARNAHLPSVERIVTIGPELDTLIANAPTHFSRPRIEEWDTWTIPYTSGTTGTPKGVLLPHRSRVLVGLASAAEFGCFSPDDTFLAISPMHHGGGLGFPIASLLGGGTVEILSAFDPAEALGRLCGGGITGTFMVPTHFHDIFALPPETLRAHHGVAPRAIICNAAPLPHTVKLRVLDHFGEGVLHEIYGATESGLVSNLRPHLHRRKQNCVGLPFAGCAIRLLDEHGSACASGEIGEIYASSPFMFNGYCNRPDETHAAFRGGYLSVGDLGRLDDEGFLYIVDRKKDMVISGGVNIYPREIEEVLFRHPAIREVAVIGVPDPRWGERLKAFAVLRSGQSLNAADLARFCEGKLAGYKVPRDVETLASLPRNASGKVLKRALRAERA